METGNLAALLASRQIKMADLARDLKLNKSSITMWAQRRVPAERVLEVEKLTGISRHEIRPDIYPTPTQETAA